MPPKGDRDNVGDYWDMNSNYTDVDVPYLVATDVVQVEAANGSAVFLKKDGTVWQMGARATLRYGYDVPTNKGLSNIIKVGVGSTATGDMKPGTTGGWTYFYALNSSGQVYLWYSTNNYHSGYWNGSGHWVDPYYDENSYTA